MMLIGFAGILGIGSALIGAVSSVLGHKEQSRQADAEAARVARDEARLEEQREAIRMAGRVRQRDLLIQTEETREASRVDIEQARRQGRAAQAQASVGAAAAGVGGLSVAAQAADIAGGEARFISGLERQLESTVGQITRMREAARIESEAAIQSVPFATPARVQEPSLLGLGASLLGSVIQTGLFNRPAGV